MSVHDDLVSNNRFVVSIGPATFSFSSVTNISHSINVDDIQEGGRNDTPRFVVSPKRTGDQLVLERGIQTGMQAKHAGETFTPGASICLCTIMVLDRSMSIAKAYSFDEGIVTKWEIDNLDANDSRILVRRVEIRHSGLYEIL